MTAAAEKLEISQPSISKTLKNIEENLGFKLFLRKGKRLTPTHEAGELYEHASIVTNQLKNFNYIANTYKSRSLDFINIGTTPSLAETIVPKIIKEYKKIKPDIRFNLINLNSTKSTTLKKGKHFLVSSKKYKLKEKIYLNEITHLPYIEITNLLSLYSESSIMNYFLQNNLTMNFSIKSDSYSSALSIINEGMGISILDENTISRANLDLVNISDIQDTEFEYKISALMKKEIIKKECNDFFNYLCD